MAKRDNPIVKVFEGFEKDIQILQRNVIRVTFVFNSETYENLLRFANDTGLSITQIIQMSSKKPCINCGTDSIQIPTDLSMYKRSISSKKTFAKNG